MLKKRLHAKHLEWPMESLVLKVVSADTSTPVQREQDNVHICFLWDTNLSVHTLPLGLWVAKAQLQIQDSSHANLFDHNWGVI